MPAALHLFVETHSDTGPASSPEASLPSSLVLLTSSPGCAFGCPDSGLRKWPTAFACRLEQGRVSMNAD